MATMLAYSVLSGGATVVRKGGGGAVIKTAKPVPPKGFALIRVLLAGVCNTDLEILKGYMGFQGILGHEFVGIVEEVNDETHQDWIGKRVCGDINIRCGRCSVCNNDGNIDQRCPQMSRNHCPDHAVLGMLAKDGLGQGCIAEYTTLPVSNLHVIPDHVPDKKAVFAVPLAAAFRIVEQRLVGYDKDRPDRVAILGDGKIGLLIAEVIGREYARCVKNKSNESKPIIFGKHKDKLALVKDSGVKIAMLSECFDGNQVFKKHFKKYDVVIDATGSPDGFKLAQNLCRPKGTVVLKSTCAAGSKFNPASIVVDELEVVGSRCGPIDKALELLALEDTPDEDTPDSDVATRPLRVEDYITKVFSLEQADQAIIFAREKSTMKVQIICSEK